MTDKVIKKETITMYSTNCVKCNTLKKLLDKRGLDYEIVNDIELMLSKGFENVPMLEVGNKVMNYTQATEWIENLDKTKNVEE